MADTSSRSQTTARILLKDRTRHFLEFRRVIRDATGRELGLAHLTRFLAQVLPQWQRLALEGPDGLPIYLNLSNKEGYLTGGFENTVGHLEPLVSLIKDGDVVLDVGANIGVWSRYVIHKCKLSKLIAFEPDPTNFELLELNISPFLKAIPQNLAVGSKDGFAEFSRDKDSGQNHIVNNIRKAKRTRKVPIVTLDNWSQQFGIDRIDFIKIDVEGLELDVFEGARRIVEKYRPLLFFEYIPENGDLGLRKLKTFTWVQSLGYEIHVIQRGGKMLRVDTAEDCVSVVNNSHDLLAQHPQRRRLFAN